MNLKTLLNFSNLKINEKKDSEMGLKQLEDRKDLITN